MATIICTIIWWTIVWEPVANIVWTMNRHVVSLERDYADLPRLRCRPMQIKQVVLNLLVNACDANPHEGRCNDVMCRNPGGFLG